MLTDHLGREVQSDVLSNRMVDLKQLSNGIFHLQVFNQDMIYSKNLLILR